MEIICDEFTKKIENIEKEKKNRFNIYVFKERAIKGQKRPIKKNGNYTMKFVPADNLKYYSAYIDPKYSTESTFKDETTKSKKSDEDKLINAITTILGVKTNESSNIGTNQTLGANSSNQANSILVEMKNGSQVRLKEYN